MIVHRARDPKRYHIFCIAAFVMGALLLTGCGKEKSYIPPPATIIRATEEISPTAAKKEQPSATATRSLAPTASSPTESYPYPSALSTPQRTTTPVAYPTK